MGISDKQVDLIILYQINLFPIETGWDWYRVIGLNFVGTRYFSDKFKQRIKSNKFRFLYRKACDIDEQ
jgi:hypothetical protein